MKAIEAMENRFVNVRAGRANPKILDKVEVEYYGVPTPLIQLATISVPEARKIVRSHDVFFNEEKMHKKPVQTVEIRRVVFQEDGKM